MSQAESQRSFAHWGKYIYHCRLHNLLYLIFVWFYNVVFWYIRPACWDIDMLVKMLDAGMNVARLNFSHGDHKGHAQCVENLREALQ